MADDIERVGPFDALDPETYERVGYGWTFTRGDRHVTVMTERPEIDESVYLPSVRYALDKGG